MTDHTFDYMCLKELNRPTVNYEKFQPNVSVYQNINYFSSFISVFLRLIIFPVTLKYSYFLNISNNIIMWKSKFSSKKIDQKMENSFLMFRGIFSCHKLIPFLMPTIMKVCHQSWIINHFTMKNTILLIFPKCTCIYNSIIYILFFYFCFVFSFLYV